MIAIFSLKNAIGQEQYANMGTVMKVMINNHAHIILNVNGSIFLILVQGACTKIDVIIIWVKLIVLNKMNVSLLEGFVKK